MRIYGRVLAVVLAGLTLSSTANATCTQANMVGTWEAYSLSAQTGIWTRCKMTVTTTGAFTNASCVDLDANAAPVTGNVKLLNGALCAFNGKIVAGGETSTIKHMTLSQDKITAEGVGTFPGGTFIFSLTKI